MDRSSTIISSTFSSLALFRIKFDKLKTGQRPTLFSGEPLLSSRRSKRFYAVWDLSFFGSRHIFHAGKIKYRKSCPSVFLCSQTPRKHFLPRLLLNRRTVVSSQRVAARSSTVVRIWMLLRYQDYYIYGSITDHQFRAWDFAAVQGVISRFCGMFHVL